MRKMSYILWCLQHAASTVGRPKRAMRKRLGCAWRCCASRRGGLGVNPGDVCEESLDFPDLVIMWLNDIVKLHHCVIHTIKLSLPVGLVPEVRS